MFHDSNGSSSHGRIDFLDGSLKNAQWIRLVPTSSPKRPVPRHV